ncbi:MAG: NADH:flavin oxidoreductase, partial [Proteobacteria bacterium]|nr:NADH:flavin oxidoreductase [Pseudomonadota bacterium]
GTRLLEITEAGLLVMDPNGEREIPADTVVLALGASPFNPLAEVLDRPGLDVRIVGDAGGIGRAYEAIHQGFEAGRRL